MSIMKYSFPLMALPTLQAGGPSLRPACSCRGWVWPGCCSTCLRSDHTTLSCQHLHSQRVKLMRLKFNAGFMKGYFAYLTTEGPELWIGWLITSSFRPSVLLWSYSLLRKVFMLYLFCLPLKFHEWREGGMTDVAKTISNLANFSFYVTLKF